MGSSDAACRWKTVAQMPWSTETPLSRLIRWDNFSVSVYSLKNSPGLRWIGSNLPRQTVASFRGRTSYLRYPRLPWSSRFRGRPCPRVFRSDPLLFQTGRNGAPPALVIIRPGRRVLDFLAALSLPSQDPRGWPPPVVEIPVDALQCRAPSAPYYSITTSDTWGLSPHFPYSQCRSIGRVI